MRWDHMYRNTLLIGTDVALNMSWDHVRGGRSIRRNRSRYCDVAEDYGIAPDCVFFGG